MGREIDVQIVPKAGMVNVTVDGRAGGGSRDAVKYTPQDLTDEQKAQARENIGAVSMVDLNQRVQVVDVNDIVSLQDTNLILVMSEEDGKVAEILPSGQAEEYGWLYDWQEGWRVADIAGFTYFGRTWLDLLQYMEEHSTPLDVLTYGVVRHDIAQTLTQSQQTQARNNIDAASKAQVTRIALNVGYTDKIKDTATTMRELSERVSIINVLDGDIIAGCILPSSQTGTIGWLYEFEEGWMLTKDISGYVIGEHTWEDLLWYLDANSSKIMTYERMLETTGDKSQLTTTDKSNLVNAINEVAQGGGGGSEWKLVYDGVRETTDPRRVTFTTYADNTPLEAHEVIMILRWDTAHSGNETGYVYVADDTSGASKKQFLLTFGTNAAPRFTYMYIDATKPFFVTQFANAIPATATGTSQTVFSFGGADVPYPSKIIRWLQLYPAVDLTAPTHYYIYAR